VEQRGDEFLGAKYLNRIGEFTAEAQRTLSKGFFIMKHSELCELGVSAVKSILSFFANCAFVAAKIHFLRGTR
jgi:hypothetical protein